MIDKKTYEDLMNYLVKTECSRLNHHQDGTSLKAPAPMIVSTPSHNSVKPGAHGPGNQTAGTGSVQTSNLNSINSAQHHLHHHIGHNKPGSNSRGASPGGGSRQQTIQLSNSTVTSGKKSKAAAPLHDITSSSHSTFQS